MAAIESGVDSTILTIDPISKAARATLYDLAGQPIVRTDKDFKASNAGLVVMGVNDGNARVLRTDQMGNIGTATINPVLWDQWEGTTVNTQRWAITATTFVTAQTAVGLNLNSTNLTTANAVNVALSRKQVARTARNPIYYKNRLRVTNTANSVNDWGLADNVSGVTAIANGAYFQVTTTGAVQAVISTLSVANAFDLEWTGAVFEPLQFYTCSILLDDDNAQFFMQDTATGQVVAQRSIPLTSSASRLFAATHLRAFDRCYNTAVVPAAAPVHISSFVFVGYTDAKLGKTNMEILATNHQHTGIHPTTMAQAAAYTNSAEPASATLSNTTASYATLGGKFQFLAVAGAATDYALFGFQVPAPYTLVVRGISIDVWNTGAASATTATLLTWSTMSNSPAATLASALPAHRQHLGAHSIPAGTAVGTAIPSIQKSYNIPLVTEGGNFFVIALRMPVGTATASQIIAGAIQVDGYFE